MDWWSDTDVFLRLKGIGTIFTSPGIMGMVYIYIPPIFIYAYGENGGWCQWHCFTYICRLTKWKSNMISLKNDAWFDEMYLENPNVLEIM
jgi:hypothetical protein